MNSSQLTNDITQSLMQTYYKEICNRWKSWFWFLLEYHEAFKCFDLNENGTLSTKELKYAMRMLGSNPTDAQIQQLVNAKDFDGKMRLRSAVWPYDGIGATKHPYNNVLKLSLKARHG